MNTVILTIILFFNGTTHHITKEFDGNAYYPGFPVQDKNMGDCAKEITSMIDAFAKVGSKIISIQCTVKPLKE